MPLDKPTISNTLRHLEYDILGLWQSSPSGQALAYGGGGFRYFGSYGQLLYRLAQMAPDEESRLTGRAYGAIGFTGPDPFPGDTVSATITGGGLSAPITVNVVVQAVGPLLTPWTNLTLASALAQAFALTPAFIAAGFTTVADYGSGPFSNQRAPVPICSIIAAPCQSFTLTTSYTGTSVPQVLVTGAPLSPFISFNPGTQVVKIYGYLPILDYLEGAYGGETFTLSASVANGVSLDSNRLDNRIDQYEVYKRKLSKYLGIPINPCAQELNSSNQMNFS